MCGIRLAGAFLAIGGATVSGCSALPHNDVLIFGTETTVAVDVGSSATNGGTPEITIGYKREEAVWLPLLANGRDSKPRPPAGTMYRATGPDSKAQDAYSVFASFGAELEGGTGKAKVGLAQFFATGIAAQRLATNPAAVLALTVKSPEQGKADAEAVAAVASAATSSGIAQGTKDAAVASLLFNCALKNGSKIYARPASIAGNSTLEAAFDAQLSSASTPAAYQTIINTYPDFESPAVAVAAASNCK